ncbi:MAG: ThiF family adenylyltransferase [Enterococcus sp.]|uniref:ThiF family adenylyltransferase n=1 Tax=Enterococcus sp. TaxID=35783 RepID=UPI002648BF6A|nr:ThiF family adenylyltransferase [Enterococcus sp.]MDN6775562.1 ThiF family adenylyltransferase [Enterococcus sp.]
MVNETLQILNIPYELKNGVFHFEYRGIQMLVDQKGTVSVSKNYFGSIPHVMKDGSVCVFSGIDSMISSGENFELKETIEVYIPYLFGLTAEQKTGEFLLELEYYISELLDKQCDVTKEEIHTFTVVEIVNSQNLWETLDDISDGCWYKLIPVNLENEYVFVKKENARFQIEYDEVYKAKLRVSGRNVSTLGGKTVFIGMGSVNSYALKIMFSRGLADITIIDDDKIEIGNLFRHAFPYRGMYKVDAAERFLQIVDKKMKAKKVYSKISFTENNKSPDYLDDVQRIVVSVDNFFSWIQVFHYVEEYCQNNCEIIFVGIDVYGGYGKFFKIEYKEKNQFFENFKKFLLDFPNGKSRSNMVGTGCGESIAIYDEQNIVSLIKEMLTCNSDEGVKYVDF